MKHAFTGADVVVIPAGIPRGSPPLIFSVSRMPELY